MHCVSYSCFVGGRQNQKKVAQELLWLMVSDHCGGKGLKKQLSSRQQECAVEATAQVMKDQDTWARSEAGPVTAFKDPLWQSLPS